MQHSYRVEYGDPSILADRDGAGGVSRASSGGCGRGGRERWAFRR